MNALEYVLFSKGIDISKFLDEVVLHEMTHDLHKSGNTNIKDPITQPVYNVFTEALPTFTSIVLNADESKDISKLQRKRIVKWVKTLDSFMKHLDRFIPINSDRVEFGGMLGYMLGASAAIEAMNHNRKDQLESIKTILRKPIDGEEVIRNMIPLAEKNGLISENSVNFFNYYMRYTNISMGPEPHYPFHVRLVMKFISSMP